MATKKNTSTTADGDDELADASVAELDQAANSPQNPKTVVEPEVRGEHVPYQNRNEAVHQSPVTRVDEDLGIGVRDPYPTGNPRPAEDIAHEIRGVPLKEEDDDDGQKARRKSPKR